MSPIVLSQILGLFVTTFNVDGKHPGSDCKNLQLPIQMELSEKRKAFSQLFVPFLESTSNFKHFEKKTIVIANVFPKVQTVENLLRPLSKKRRFGTLLNSQHVKTSQIPAKSP